MGRRIISRRDLRAEAEAAEARGIPLGDPRAQRDREREKERLEASDRTVTGPRMKVVWAVCDVGGRTVATFPYTDKPAAEALAAELKAQTRDLHFVRAIKKPF